MARFNMVIQHGLPQDEALRRVQDEIENLKREYGDKVGDLRESWNNDRCVFQGATLVICGVGSDTGEAI